jgi:hypothetical protein
MGSNSLPEIVLHNHDMPMYLSISQDEKQGKVGPTLVTCGEVQNSYS